ncbi:MAG: type I-E CRISPR-associated protein Cse1/CasA [Desulfarculales bacterium]|jgi:CRISPR system Cascade subunit CasA|nr:type I-E CRISPR-associated protein Cse1/CasA [Desulfarculales bacterium]
MTEKIFNLLYEPWILVMKADGSVEEVGIVEMFARASQLRGLAGELPAQDMAVLRFLLAILHVACARYDLEGKDDPLCLTNSPPASPDMALRRWKALWDKGKFPMEILEKYLKKHEERFYLFHPQYPFYQVPAIGKATKYSAAKLNGELSESGNKPRLFPQRSGQAKERLTYPEAARWLLYVNGFDDTSAKSPDHLSTPGVGWLGRLGLVSALGDNLFATLLLNLVLLRGDQNDLWGEEKPIWEQEVRRQEREEIMVPDNLSQLLTLQSRRLLLLRDQNGVSGYKLLGGDFFPKDKEQTNIFAEQMTLWRNIAKKETSPSYIPKRHDPARQLWRDFAALLASGASDRPPGVVKWLARLKGEDLLAASQFRLQVAAVTYRGGTDKTALIDDVFSDSLTFNAGLLSHLGADWVRRIIGEIEDTEKLVYQVGELGQRLAQAAGSADGKGPKNMAEEQAYFRLDQPFRTWLEEIDPEKDEMWQRSNEWWERSKSIVQELGRELVAQAGPNAFVGRIVEDKKKKKHRYIAPEEYNFFMIKTSSRQALNRKGGTKK